jgi:hypothetical protein
MSGYPSGNVPPNFHPSNQYPNQFPQQQPSPGAPMPPGVINTNTYGQPGQPQQQGAYLHGQGPQSGIGGGPNMQQQQQQLFINPQQYPSAAGFMSGCVPFAAATLIHIVVMMAADAAKPGALAWHEHVCSPHACGAVAAGA